MSLPVSQSFFALRKKTMRKACGGGSNISIHTYLRKYSQSEYRKFERCGVLDGIACT